MFGCLLLESEFKKMSWKHQEADGTCKAASKTHSCCGPKKSEKTWCQGKGPVKLRNTNSMLEKDVEN